MALGQPQQPADTQPNPYLPGNPQPLICEQWNGVRTDTNRVGVPDESVYWMDGIMPYAPRRARSMYGIGTAIFTAAGGLTIIFYRFVTLAGNPLCIVVMSDGSILSVNTSTGVQTTVATADTILSPDQLACDINQWGNLYVLIVARQTNGYWVWDGSILYAAGTLGPAITLTSIGSGYTSAPIVTASGGHGSGAQFTAYLNSTGGVGSVVMTNPGTGYLAGDTVSLIFTGGLSSGANASLHASLTQQTPGSGASATISFFNTITASGVTYYAIKSIAQVATGSGYSQFAKAIPTGGGTFSPAALSPVVSGGQITSVSIVNGGLFVAKPNLALSITDTGGYFISSVSVVAVGTGYSNFPVITYTVANSQSLVQTPALTPVINNGTFTSVSIVSGGLQAGSTVGTLVITDTAAAAAGSISLMPYAISGNTIETYQGYVWIGNGAIIFNSAPGSVSDFNTSDGGGNLTSNDSFLKVGYTKFCQINGFLYLVSDCAVSYISGVQTTVVGAGPNVTTTYTKQNADPEVGSSWPNAVLPWGNALMLANSWGEFVGYGSRMEKVSEPMDGVYGSVPSPSITPSMAKAIVYNRKIVCLLIPIVDPVAGTQQNKLLIWDGKKWWASLQDVTLTYIQTQELNSILTAWGTDGTHIYPLFNTPSTAFAKTIQTKLWDEPGGYMFQKAAGRFWGVLKYNTVSNPTLTLNVDQEAPAQSATYTLPGPSSTGYYVVPPEAVGQQGVFTGLTISTSEGDIEFVLLALSDDVVGYRG